VRGIARDEKAPSTNIQAPEKLQTRKQADEEKIAADCKKTAGYILTFELWALNLS
jgi:hypothetical protein